MYLQDDSKYGGAEPGTSFGFYKLDTKAKPSEGDEVGNEVLILSYMNKSPEVEKKFQNSNEFIGGKPILKSNSFVEILGDRYVIHLGYKAEGKSYFDQILSTFEFVKGGDLPN